MIKLIKPLFSFLVIFCINTISSQNQFRINYDIGNFDIPGGITEASSGNYVFAGFNSTSLSFHSNVVELDVAGNVIWANKYESGFAFNISDIKTLSSSNYIVAGADNSNAILMNLDVSGNLSWGKSYSFLNATGSYCNRVKATSDGGYVVAGSVTGFDSDGSGPQPQRDSSNIFIFKTNSTGTLLWKKVLYVNIDDDHTVNDVAEVVDGYIFVGYVSEIGNPDIGDAIILKTDFLGNLQWFNKFGGAGNHQEFTSAETLSSGEVLIGGVNDGDNMCLVKINSSGSLTWGYEYDPGGGWLGTDVAINFDAFETVDNKYASLGMYVEFNLPPTMGSYLTKIEPSNGNIIFQKFYSSGMATIIPEGIQTTDQGYLMSMMAQQATGFNFHVLKTDLNGDTPPSCAPVVITFSKTTYIPSPTSVSYTEFSDVGDNNFAPVVSAVTPNEVVDCISCSLTDPTPTATPDTICLGASTTIDATGSGTSVTYDVYAAATGGSSLGTTPLILSPGTTTTYYVEASNGTCSSNRIAITVTVNPLPDAGVNGAITLCATDPSTDLFLQLGGSPDVGGTWSPAMASGTGIFDPAIDAAGTYTYSLTNSCGTVTADVVVTIISCPCPIVITDTLIHEQCIGACDGEITINITGGSGPYQVEWFDGTGTSLGIVTGVVSTTTLSNLCSGTYSVDVTEASSGGTTTVWTEDFESGINGWTLNVSTGTNGADYNYFEMDDDEGGMPVGQCGVANNGDNTLHVTSVFFPSGGAAYDAGGLCGIVNCPESNRRSESPNINTSGFTGLTLKFNFIGNGDALTDNASLFYNDGSGWSVLDPSLKSPVCGGGQGQWTAYSVALPVSCENIPNLQIGFNWTNNDDGIGTDPSFAVNDIEIESSSTGCTQSATYVINSGTLTVPVAGTNGAITLCTTDPSTDLFLQLGGSPDLGGTWSPSMNSGTGFFDPVVDPSGTYTYTVTNVCGTTSADIVVNITSNPDPGTNGAITLCATDPSTDLFLQLGGSPDPGGTWSPAMASGTGMFNPAVDPAGTYTYNLSACGGGTLTADVLVNVDTLPLINAGLDMIVCDSFAITLSASGGQSYVWDNGITDGISFIQAIGTTTYNVIGTDINGCDNSDSVTITVNPQPTINMSSDTTICIGQSVDLFADTNGLLVEQFTMTFDNPFSYSTINTSLPGSYYVVVSGTFTTTGMPHRRDGAYNYGNNPPTQNYEWKWNAQNPNTQSTWNNTYNTNHIYYFYFTGGSSQTFSFTENINAPGYNPGWWNDNYGSLTFDIYYYGNILWSNSVTTSINNVSPIQTTNYTVSIDYGNGCATSGAVLVTTVPNVDPGLNGSITFCPNELTPIDLFTCIGGTPDPGGVWSPAMASGTGFFDPAVDPAGTYTYSLPGCNGGTVSSFVNVYFHPYTIVPLPLDTITICQGDSILLTGTYQNTTGVYYELWSSGFPNNSCDTVKEVMLLVLPIIDASIISDSVFCEEDPSINLQAMNSGGVWSGTGITDVNLGTFNPSIANAGNHLITYDIPNTCGDSGTLNILVNETPNITELSKNDSCMLSNGYIDLSIIGGASPYSYYWNNNEITDSIFGLTAGTYIVTVTDNEGCIKSDTIILEDDLLFCGGSLWLPNIFSPNNDLLNDILYVRGTEGALTFEFIIYNRWGQKVYYSTNPEAGWDGTFDDKILNDAVFAYLVKATFLDGTDAVLSGTITLVK